MVNETILVAVLFTVVLILAYIAICLTRIKTRMEFGETSLVYAILHDEFINPLHKVIDTLEDLRDGLDDSNKELIINVDCMLDDMGILMDSAEKMGRATSLEQENYVQERVVTDLVEIVQDAILDMHEEAERRGVILTMEEGGETKKDTRIYILADHDNLRYMFKNLIHNGIKHRDLEKEESWVCVSIMKSGSKVEVSIADNGTGITDKKLQSLGRNPEPQKLHHDAKEGNGYGHYFIQKYLTLHGADWDYNSELREGTRVDIIFPVARSH